MSAKPLSHNASLIAWWLENGVIMTIVVDSAPKNPLYFRDYDVRIKIPGGGNKRGESTDTTARREFREETNLFVKHRVRLIPVLSRWLEADKHWKEAFVVPRSECRGKLHTKPVIDGDSTIMPRFISIEEAIKIVHQPLYNTFHRDALIVAQEKILEILEKRRTR